jgi:hypothetical protein
MCIIQAFLPIQTNPSFLFNNASGLSKLKLKVTNIRELYFYFKLNIRVNLTLSPAGLL